MEQRQLLNFLYTCEEKHITKAADRRFITRQGLSRSLRQLEEELGVKLFKRCRNGVELTEYGLVLERAAKVWIKQHDDILATIKNMKDKDSFRLFVGIEDSLVVFLPDDFFNGFLNAYPEIDLSIRTITSRDCQKYILEEKLQIGITAPPIDTERFDSFLLEKRKYYLVVGKHHRLAGKDSVKLEELQGEEAIIRYYLLDKDDLIEKFCVRNGIKINTRLNFLDKNLIMKLLETGRYIFFGLESFFDSENFRYIEVENTEIYMESFLVVNKQTSNNKAVEFFIAWSREQFKLFNQA